MIHQNQYFSTSLNKKTMKKVCIGMVIFIFATSLGVANSAPTSKKIETNRMAVLNATPPAAVLASFQTIFGNVPVNEWKLRKNGDWRAHFLRNGVAWEATFTGNGVLVKSEADLN
jgi:hypothetical protein